MSGFLTTQAIGFMLAYTTLSTLLFLPTIDYEQITFKQRVYYALYLLFGGAFAAYSVNCMIIGQCFAWSWILMGLFAFTPMVIGLLFIFFYDTMKMLWERVKDAFKDVIGEEKSDSDSELKINQLIITKDLTPSIPASV